MPYRRRIDRGNPGCVIFLLDQSAGMNKGCAGSRTKKSLFVARMVNRFLCELVCGCEVGEDKPRHWFDVGLVGYTTDHQGAAVVESAFAGELAGRDLVSIPDLYDHPLEIEKRQKKEFLDDGAGGLQEVVKEINFPVWYRPPPPERMFGAAMCAGFDHVRNVLENWLVAHPDSFPPMVIHLTDGEAVDGDPEPEAERVKELATSDGNVLFINGCPPSWLDKPVLFPVAEAELPEECSRALFRMSSMLPDGFRQAAEVIGISVPLGGRAMAYNADKVSLVSLLKVCLSRLTGTGLYLVQDYSSSPLPPR